MAVTDLAPAGAAHRARLADGERREVVMVHVAFECLRAESVDALLVGDRSERRSSEDLRLAACEQAGAMRPRHHGGAACDVSDLIETPAVGAGALVDDHRPQFVFLARLD